MAAAPPVGSRNSLAGSSTASLDGADRPLVGRVEGAQRLDLVAEALDPDRQRLRRREDVDDAAAARELAAAGDLGHRLVAEVEQVAQQRVLVEPRARVAGRRGSAGRSSGASVCWNSAWTLATRTRARPGPPRGEGGDPGGRLVATSSLRS